MPTRLPCKTNKCLKYPSCISLNVVDCDILRDIYMTLMNENKGLANRTAKTWGTIRMTLPNVLTIKGAMIRDNDGNYSVRHQVMPLDAFTKDMIWDK
jgi:hypothetical protein